MTGATAVAEGPLALKRNRVQPLAGYLGSRDPFAFVAGLAIVIGGAAILEIGRLNTWDEAWLLHVATRLSAGDALYRDVFYGTTPLAAYIAAFLASTFGPELLVLKAAGIACLTLTFVLALGISRQLEAAMSPIVLGAAIVVTQLPYTFGYSILATTLAVAALAALLAWYARFSSDLPSSRWLIVSGLAAGACIATKHNVGAYVSVALMVSVALLVRERRGSGLGHLVAPTTAFLVPLTIATVATALPIVLSGGLERALDFTVLSKVGYLTHAQTSYMTGLTDSLNAFWPDSPVSLGSLLAGLHQARPLVYLLPPATVLAAAWMWRYRPGAFRGAGLPVILIAAAAAAAILPRAEQSHVTVVAPLFLIALGYLARGASGTGLSLLRIGCVSLAALLVTSGPMLWLRTGSERSATPHLQGLVLIPTYEDELVAQAREIRSAIGGDTAFLLFPEAGLYYLLGEMRNPTPYDFPLRTAFGTEGQRLVVEQMTRGEIRYVCLRRNWGFASEPLPGPFPALQPLELTVRVREALTLVTSLAACDLYASGPSR